MQIIIVKYKKNHYKNKRHKVVLLKLKQKNNIRFIHPQWNKENFNNEVKKKKNLNDVSSDVLRALSYFFFI